MTTIVISALIGAALGLRWNVFILIPTIILAAICTAVIEVARGDHAGSVALVIALVFKDIARTYRGVDGRLKFIVGLFVFSGEKLSRSPEARQRDQISCGSLPTRPDFLRFETTRDFWRSFGAPLCFC